MDHLHMLKNAGKRKVVTFIFLLTGLLTSVCYAKANRPILHDTDSTEETVRQKKISLNIQNKPLRDILFEIQNQSGIGIAYRDNGETDKVKNISFRADDITVEEALATLLKDTDLDFRISQNTINIVKSQSPQKDALTGKVTNSKGEPLADVTVYIKGSTVVTITDKNGMFRLDVAANDVVIFSFIGLKTQEITYKGQKNLNVVMEEDKVALEDVVVTGYGNIDRKSFTGSAIRVTRDELLKTSPNNILQSLQIFDPSFKVMENNERGSDPNTMPEIYIRGRSGIVQNEQLLSEQHLKNNPNMPTFILDGYEVEVEKIFDLDPSRVESITILKDAASTAIYGARAANGVVVIETIKPSKGELRVNYIFNGSVTFPDLSDYNLLNAKEKVELERLAGVFDPKNLIPSEAILLEQSYYNKLMEANRGVNTYWLSKPLQTEYNHKHNILIEGGSDEFIFGLDLKLGRTSGVMIGSERNANAIGFSIAYRKNKIMFRNYIEWNNIQSQESPFGSFSTYAELNPYDTYLDENGNDIRELKQWIGHSGVNINPLYDAHLNSYDRTTSNEFTNNFNLKWFISDQFHFDSRIAITNSRSEQEVFKDPVSTAFDQVNDYLEKGSKYVANNNSVSWDANAFLRYAKPVGNHQINFTIGGNARETDQSTSSYTLFGFPSGMTDDINFGATIKDKPQGASDRSRTIGLFGMLNYTYRNIYLLDFSGRYDGASQFGNNSKFAPFWSAGGGINIHNYTYIQQHCPWINNLKIRSNYGQVGNANFAQSLSKSTYNYNFEQWYAFGIGATMITLGNPDLEWEKTRTLDIGADIALFNRFMFSATYYNKKTIDLIGDITLPISTGFTSFKSNLGEIVNEGYELNARYNTRAKQNYNVSFYLTLAHNTNKFVKIYNTLREYNLQVEKYYREHRGINKPLMKYYEGASQTAIYTMKSLGINPADGKEIFQKKDGTPTYEWDASEHVITGDTEPDIRGAFGFNINYKAWFVFTGFLYEYGGRLYNSTLVDKVENANVYKNVDRRVFSDRWQKPGDHTWLKDIKDWNTRTQVTSRFVQKNNYISINSITVGYTVPRTLLTRFYLENCKVQMTMNDLGRISTIKRERGTSYPFARTVNLSLNLSF